jgi:hypothetical protein
VSVITDLRNGAKAVLDTVAGLEQTYSARPAGLGALPCAFVDEIRTQLLHTAGVRQWDGGEVDIYVVAGGFDNEEAQADADTLVEAVIDAFSDTPHFAGANTVGEPVRVRSGVVDNGNGQTFPAWIVTVGRFYFSEGR